MRSASSTPPVGRKAASASPAGSSMGKRAVRAAQASAPTPAASGAGFGDMVQNVMQDMTQQTRAAETQMTQSISGQGNLIDVVTALSSAEASLAQAEASDLAEVALDVGLGRRAGVRTGLHGVLLCR